MKRFNLHLINVLEAMCLLKLHFSTHLYSISLSYNNGNVVLEIPTAKEIAYNT